MTQHRRAAGRCLLALLFALAQAGCTTWELTDIVAPATVPANREIKVWTAGSTVHLRGVQVTADSLSGVPVPKSANCHTCRVSLPLRAVDSTKSASSEALPVILIGAAAVFFLSAIVTNQGSPTSYPAD